MKNIFLLPVILFFYIYISGCSGYKPIFSASDLKFVVEDHEIEGDKKLGNIIYSKLYNLSKGNEKKPKAQSVNILIKISKDKISTAKDSTGKILEYKTTINANFLISDYLSNEKILDKNYILSSSYKAHDQYSETIKNENIVIENLLNKIYQDILVSMSQYNIK